MRLEDVFKIEAATNGLITWFHLAGCINLKIKRLLTGENKVICELRISERVGLGMAHDKEIGLRQGMRSDLKPRENFPRGHTEALAAIYCGLGNYKTYRQAKRVVELGAHELIQAMDNKRVAISAAAQLTSLSKDKLHIILRLDKKGTIVEVKEIERVNHSTIQLSKNSLNIFLHHCLKIYFLLMPHITL
jgi:hypothetical protein